MVRSAAARRVRVLPALAMAYQQRVADGINTQTRHPGA